MSLNDEQIGIAVAPLTYPFSVENTITIINLYKVKNWEYINIRRIEKSLRRVIF